MTRPRLKLPRPALLVWFGLLGPPCVWTAQFVFGMGSTLAKCSPSGLDVPLTGWTLAATAGAAFVIVLALASSIAVYVATRDAGEEPPEGRVHFLSVVGITVGTLLLFVVLLSGITVPVLEACRQS